MRNYAYNYLRCIFPYSYTYLINVEAHFAFLDRWVQRRMELWRKRNLYCWKQLNWIKGISMTYRSKNILKVGLVGCKLFIIGFRPWISLRVYELWVYFRFVMYASKFYVGKCKELFALNIPVYFLAGWYLRHFGPSTNFTSKLFYRHLLIFSAIPDERKSEKVSVYMYSTNY